jgi:peptidyl-prolyl cis-trans isomerase D
MFEFIRKHQRWVLSFLLVLILPSFIFFGIDGYTNMGDGQNTVAKVGSYKITRQEWEEAQRAQLERMRQMFGNQFDQSMFDTPQMKQAVLDNLIAQYALSAESDRAKLAIPASVLRETILNIPGLTKPDGSFDEDQYRMLLAAQGMNANNFQSRLARDMAIQQLNGVMQSTSYTPKAVADKLSDLNDQERTVAFKAFNALAYTGQVKVTDEMLQAYYKANIAQFQIPEHAKVEYVELNRAVVDAQISVTDAELQSYYDQNVAQYTTPEERRASHILIEVPASASDADKAAAKAEAESILEKLKANPNEFAKLAKEFSKDPGSADKGGDLGFFSKGLMVKSFEDAAYQLQKNEISPLVESEFGYHIIVLTDIKPAVVKPFSAVKDQIETAVKGQLFTKKYAELADQFNNLVYEQSDSLKPVADKLMLKIQTVNDVTRQPNPALGASPVNSPKFLAALFTNEVIKSKHNSEVVEVAPYTLIAGRIIEYGPVSTRPFDEVKSIITTRVVQEQESKLAQEAGEAALAKLRANENADVVFSAPEVVSQAKSKGWNETNFSAVMRADVSKLPAYVGVNNGDKYTIYRITKVEVPANKDEERRKAEREQIANVLAQQETLAYIEALKQKAKSEVLPAANTAAATPAQDVE